MISRKQSILWTELDGHVVLLNVEHGRYYEVNGLGGVIWSLLEDQRSMSDVIEHVVSRYRVGREQCRSDVEKFFAALGEAGLIVESPSVLGNVAETQPG